MANVHGRKSTGIRPVKDMIRSRMVNDKEKVYILPGVRCVVDGQNRAHPWYLFPEEDLDDVSAFSDSDVSYTSDEDDDYDDLDDDEEEEESDKGDGNAKRVDVPVEKKIKTENMVDAVPVEKTFKIKMEEQILYKCTVCDKIYKKKGHLDRHQLIHMGEDKTTTQKSYCCKQCGYQASCTGNYKKHLLTHSGERPFSCHICEKSFRQKVHLKDHLRSHTGVRDFECTDCGATFVQKSSLNLHRRKHSGVRPYACGICKKAFFENQHLVSHMRTHTGERPYQCETCGQTFSAFRTLKGHKMIHTGERPFTCEVCGVSFREKATLQKHRGVHINVGPFPCTECGKEFTRLASLTLHKKMHIKDSNAPITTQTIDQGYTVIISDEENSSNEEHSDHLVVEKQAQPSPPELQIVEQNRPFGTRKSKPFQETKPRAVESPNKSKMSSVASGSESEFSENSDSNRASSRGAKKNAPPSRIPRIEGTVLKDHMASTYTRNHNVATVTNDRVASSISEFPPPSVSEYPSTITGDYITPPITCSPNASLIFKDHTAFSVTSDHIASKWVEKDTPFMENTPHPEHVRQALELGTVWETKDEDGNELIVVLPAFLSNKELILTSPNKETVLPLQNPKPSSLKSLIALSGLHNTYEVIHDVEKEVPMPEDVQNFPNGSAASKDQIEDVPVIEDYHSSDGSLDAEVFASSSVECDPLDVKSDGGYEERMIPDSGRSYEERMIPESGRGYEERMIPESGRGYEERMIPESGRGYGGRIIQEDIHSESTGLLLWGDDGMGPITEVTYVIEEGQKEPVSIFHNSTYPSDDVRTTPLQSKRDRSSLEDGIEFSTPDIHFMPKRRKREGGATGDGKRKSPRKMRERKVKPKRVYECNQCGKTCKTSSNFISHLRTHSGERPYFCDVCGVGFKQIAHLKSHVRIHTGEKPYVCNICGASFTQTSRLNSHKRVRHVEGKEPKKKVVRKSKIRNFFCHICEKTFLDECFKRDHMEQHKLDLNGGDTNAKSDPNKQTADFQCDVCGIVYSNRATFNKHRLQHSDNKLICEVCGCSYATMYALKNHSLQVHGVKVEANNAPGMYINVKIGKEEDFFVVNPSVKCVLGGNDLAVPKREILEFDDMNENPQTPIIHLTETSDGHVKSEVTTESDIISEELSSMKVVHVNKGIKDEPVTLEVDSNGLDTNEDEHFGGGEMNVKTRIMDSCKENNNTSMTCVDRKPKLKFDYINSDGKKVWLCKLCKKPFYQSSNLHCHMRGHTGEKPYKCNVCPKAFKQITHLKEHMHKHTGMKNFGCTTCGAHFTQRGAVKRHINVIHNGEGDVEKVKSFSQKRKNPVGVDGYSFVRNRTKKAKEDLPNPPQPLMKVESCEYCGKKYHSSYMKCHIRCHTGEKPFKCKSCGESFRQKSHLKSHIVRHTGKRPFVCSLCGASYMHLVRLKKHKESCVGDVWKKNGTHHYRRKMKDADVTTDDSDFFWSDDDNSAPATVKEEGDMSQSAPPPPSVLYKCYRCNESYGNRKHLKIHEYMCGVSSSDSDVSRDSKDIPYQDESDHEEIVISRKNRKKKMEQNKVKPVSAKNDSEDESDEELVLRRKHVRKSKSAANKKEPRSVKKENNAVKNVKGYVLVQDCKKDGGKSDESKDIGTNVVCKICGAMFRRTSALKFHHKMKHEHENEETSEEEEEEEEENSEHCSEDDQVDRDKECLPRSAKSAESIDAGAPQRRNNAKGKIVEKKEDHENLPQRRNKAKGKIVEKQENHGNSEELPQTRNNAKRKIVEKHENPENNEELHQTRKYAKRKIVEKQEHIENNEELPQRRNNAKGKIVVKQELSENEESPQSSNNAKGKIVEKQKHSENEELSRRRNNAKGKIVVKQEHSENEELPQSKNNAKGKIVEKQKKRENKESPQGSNNAKGKIVEQENSENNEESTKRSNNAKEKIVEKQENFENNSIQKKKQVGRRKKVFLGVRRSRRT